MLELHLWNEHIPPLPLADPDPAWAILVRRLLVQSFCTLAEQVRCDPRLADDYQLSVRIADLGLRVHLSDYIVTSVLGAPTFREQWDREVRFAGFASQALMILGVSLLLYWWVARMFTTYTGDEAARRWLIWLPVRDMLSALVWCVGGLSRFIVWRGQVLMLQPDGRMQPPSQIVQRAAEKTNKRA